MGGGYPKDALALVPLFWMMCRARDCGLEFLRRKWGEYREDADPHGRMYDSRTGLSVLYRYGRRELLRPPGDDDPAIHESVFERIRRGTDYYAPKIIKDDRYIVVLND